MSTPQPAIFLGHGSPMNAIEDNQFTAAWEALGKRFGKPKAILAISAHWLTSGVVVTAMAQPKTIHDFGGFPPALFATQYPTPGSPELAQRVSQLLASHLAPASVTHDHSWGLDHGTWSVLIKMYPDADVPIVQLGLSMHEDLPFHFELGRQLAALRDEGVMIISSGNVVHNLRALNPRIAGYDWAERFQDSIRTSILQENFSAVVDYGRFGQDAQLSVPTTEHYLPLLYVLGAKRSHDHIEIVSDELVMGSISMMSVVVAES